MLYYLMIGYGTMGGIHAAKIKTSGKDTRLTIIDTNPERLKAAAIDGYEAYPDLASALKKLQSFNVQQFDVVVITSNTATHYQYLEKILDTCTNEDLSLPAIFVEKPLVGTAEEAMLLQRLLEKNGHKKDLRFMCAYLLRESPAVAHLINKLKQENDTITYVNIIWQKQREPKRPSAGVVQDETTHSLDLVLYIMRELGMNMKASNLEVSSAVRTTAIVDQEAQNSLYPEEGDKNRNPIAEVRYKLRFGDVNVEALSSFLKGPQQRTIEFICKNATYKLEFDKNKADWCEGLPFPNDKIAGLWGSFISMIETGVSPTRVATVDQSIDDVMLTDFLEKKADQYLKIQKDSNMLTALAESKELKETPNRTYCGFKPGFLR